jgi:putative transposase
MTIRRTLKYRLYRNRRNHHLHQRINIAGCIWNHTVALQKRYYRLAGGYISRYDMQRHIAKLRRQSNRYAFWKKLNAQSIQDVVERLDRAYRHFFTCIRNGVKARPPGYKKVKEYKSFTLKQTGWKYLGGNHIRIQGYTYKFSLSRPVEGQIKTVTVKRDNLGHLWLCLSTIQEVDELGKASAGRIGGFDFGLKTFLTDHNGHEYQSPLVLKSELNDIARLSRILSRKVRGSNNWHKAKRRLTKKHRHVVNKRRDAHWKLAHQLCQRFDVLCFETLNLKGMQRRWGRKMNDLGFAGFVLVLSEVAEKTGKQVVQIDRWEPTTKTCFRCGALNDMPLSIRHFDCSQCGWSCPRDQNAALNIRAAGTSAAGLGDVRPRYTRAISA